MKAVPAKITALLVVAALALSGCSLVSEIGQVGGSAVEEAALNAELDSLNRRIMDLQGITDATATVEITGDFEFQVDVTVTASELTESAAAAVVREVVEAFSAGTLADQDASFSLIADDSSSLGFNPRELGGQDVTGEVSYWFDLQAAYGSPLHVDLHAAAGAGSNAPYTSSIESYKPGAKPNWDALRAVRDSTSADRNWQLYGIDVVGSLPTEPVAATIAALVQKLGSDPEHPFALQWDGRREALWVSIYSGDLVSGIRPEGTPTWPSVTAAVRVLAAAPVQQAGLSFYGDDPMTKVTVHLGECTGELSVGPLDEEFLSALVGAGVLTGGQAGTCIAN